MQVWQLSAYGIVQEVDVRNAEGNTPLHWACLNGCVAVADILLNHGASPASLNRYNLAKALHALTDHVYDAQLVPYKPCDLHVCISLTVAACSHSNTPVDELLGKPYQDEMLALIESYQDTKTKESSDPPDELVDGQDELVDSQDESKESIQQ